MATKKRGLGWADEKHLEALPRVLANSREMLSVAARAAREQRCKDAVNALVDATSFASAAVTTGMSVEKPRPAAFKTLTQRHQRVRAQVLKACVR